MAIILRGLSVNYYRFYRYCWDIAKKHYPQNDSIQNFVGVPPSLLNIIINEELKKFNAELSMANYDNIVFTDEEHLTLFLLQWN